MPFQWTRFRFGKRPHCVSLQRVIGDVLHENHDSLLRRWQDCLAVPGGGGHQPRFQLRCDVRRFLTLHRGIERFFEELLDPAAFAGRGRDPGEAFRSREPLLRLRSCIAGRRGAESSAAARRFSSCSPPAPKSEEYSGALQGARRPAAEEERRNRFFLETGGAAAAPRSCFRSLL